MLSNSQLANLVMYFPAIRALPEALLPAVEADAVAVSARRDVVVFDAARPCPGFFMITSGSVAAFRRSNNGKRILVCRVSAGEGCALTAAALLGKPAAGLVAIAESQVSAILIPEGLFSRLLDESPDFRRFVLGLLAQRLGDHVSLVGGLAFGGLEQRLATALLVRPYPIHVSHMELADELGSAREQVSRLLKSLEQRNIVQLGRRSIYIADEQALREIAGGAGPPPKPLQINAADPAADGNGNGGTFQKAAAPAPRWTAT